MKAIVQLRYGDVDALELREVAMPVAADGEVLVRVRAAGVHPDVWHVVLGRPYVLRLMGAGLWRPKNPVPGTDIAGCVEAVGKDVTRFRPGDEVFGECMARMQWVNGGAFAEYVAVPQHALARKPPGVTFEQAAAAPNSGLIVLANLRGRAEVQPGHKVLVNGAGGGVGTFAVQYAKAQGAVVTAVDRAEKLDLLRSIGADHVVDYTREDFTRSSERYDLIVDIPGNRSLSECSRVLTARGIYVLIGHDQFGRSAGAWLGSLPRFFKLLVQSPFTNHLPELDVSLPDKRESMAALQELLEAGKIEPVVDRAFPLHEARDAIRYLESGSARGRVVLTV